jgi:nucleotide-binding universal stress UspA family protein
MKQILVYVDQSPLLDQIGDLGALIGRDAEITLFGVCETDGDQLRVSKSLEKAEALFGQVYTQIKKKECWGQPANQILLETEQHTYDLVILPDRKTSRGFTFLRHESSIDRVAKKIHTHLLVIRNFSVKINKLLICSGAEQASLATIFKAGRMLAGLSASMGILHVMSQLALVPGSVQDDLLDTADTAVTRGTREGKHFVQAIEELRKGGVQGTIIPRLRHGLVVDEVLAEIEEGDYDLLVIGAHHRAMQSRWLEFLLDDVAEQILVRVGCNVLII